MDYKSKIYLGEVALNVADLERQTAFYNQIIGLEILKRSEKQVLLGVGQEPLVRLIETSDRRLVKQSYGLYHLAILVPSREALGNVLKHLAELKIP